MTERQEYFQKVGEWLAAHFLECHPSDVWDRFCEKAFVEGYTPQQTAAGIMCEPVETLALLENL